VTDAAEVFGGWTGLKHRWTTGQRLNDLTEKFHFMVDHHESEFKQLMTWQLLTQDKMDKAGASRQQDRKEAARERRRLNQLNEITDKRIADLVGTIMRMVPPQA
jgi:hypothetical protein